MMWTDYFGEPESVPTGDSWEERMSRRAKERKLVDEAGDWLALETETQREA